MNQKTKIVLLWSVIGIQSFIIIGCLDLYYRHSRIDFSDQVFTTESVRHEHTFGNAVVSEIVSIHDGDTFTVNIKDWPDVVGHKISIRVSGIDTPEMNDNRPEIHALAVQAKIFVVDFLKSGTIELRNLKRDKYFRLNADVYVDDKSLSDALLVAKLAHPYDGGTKTPWMLSEAKKAKK